VQCPKRKYEPTMAEMQRSPEDCVKCGVNYQDHARHVEQVKAQRAVEQRANAAASPVVREVAARYPGAKPVVVVDINMSFGAMVMFMVKWAFAAIPALLIILLLVWGFGSIVSVLRLAM
jgi:hypothetical protein